MNVTRVTSTHDADLDRREWHLTISDGRRLHSTGVLPAEVLLVLAVWAIEGLRPTGGSTEDIARSIASWSEGAAA